MDDTTYDVLSTMMLRRVEVVRLSAFEDDALLGAKATRNQLEYCWTCTPSFPLWLLRNHPELESVTYVDADLMFFSSPEPLFEELGRGSVSIIEHRYSPRLEHLAREYGIYNVEYMTFRNDVRALEVLDWWRDRCIEWCYDRIEDGKVADQMYLNDWPERFEGVVVVQHPGAGLAPWNVEVFDVTEDPGGIKVNGMPLIFYHYSSFSISDGGGRTRFAPTIIDYVISDEAVRVLYPPYEAAIRRAIDKTRSVSPGYSYGIQMATPNVAEDRFPPAAPYSRGQVRRRSSAPPLGVGWHEADPKSSVTARCSPSPRIPSGAYPAVWHSDTLGPVPRAARANAGHRRRRPAISEKRVIARNTLANASVTLLQLAASFVFMPLLIRDFGLTNYGVFLLASSVSVYLSLLDFGVSPTVTKYAAEHRARNERDELARLVSNAVAYYMAIGIVVAVLLLLFSQYGIWIFKLGPVDAALARLLFVVSAVVALFAWPLSVGMSLLAGLQRYDLSSKVGFGIVVGNVAATAAVV